MLEALPLPLRRLGESKSMASVSAEAERSLSDRSVPKGSQTKGDRVRLLSYIGRWGRARRWLPPDAHRVADIGCAFGYGTAALTAHGKARRWVVGIERNAEHVKNAGQPHPWLPLIYADATAIPVLDDSVDAVILLDIHAYLIDDLIPSGPLAYHLTVGARVMKSAQDNEASRMAPAPPLEALV